MTKQLINLEGQRHVLWQCKSCGVMATCPEVVWDEQYQEGGYHFCPNGHQWGWSKETCERERLRRERDRLAQQVAQRDDEIATHVKKIRRLERRAVGGACPCCNRSFTNMARHMKTKHPEFVAENVVPLKSAG